MKEFIGEFFKIHTWIFAVLYWVYIIWTTRRARVKLGIRGVLIFGILFLMSVLMTLAHPVIEGFLLCGFVCLMNYVFKDHSRH
jgi:predicted membrane protein